jgi:hypothetical protein
MHNFNWLRLNAWGKRGSVLAALLLLGVTAYRPAEALPLFARQTGEACAACHTVYPELTHFGRMFKLNGYQLDNGRDIEMTNDEGKSVLSLPAVPNLALFIMADYVQFKKALPDSQIPGAQSQTGNVDFPYQVSLLYGGKIAPHFGAFAQITYSNGADTFNIDNTDFRFANTIVLPNKQPLVYGVSINNNPSVEDPYNTTPAFGFPYLPPATFIPSLAAPIVEAGQAYQAAGPIGYILWNEQLYVAAGFYREARTGSSSPGNPITGNFGPIDSTTGAVLEGNNAYWRVAYEYDVGRYALMVGTYGLQFKLYPGNGLALSGATDNYTDTAFDFQFQSIGENNSATLKGTYVKENQALNASSAVGAANPHDWLSYETVDLTYWYRRKLGFDVGFVNIHGSTDPTLYPSAPTQCIAGGGGTCGANLGTPGVGGVYNVGVTNSANSNPTTDAGIFEISYVPWLNVKFTLQYTHYTKFNGASSNYDGVGRNASDNDTTFLYLWFAM